MSKETTYQTSVIDGSTEPVTRESKPLRPTQYEPIYEEVLVQRLTLDGIEVVLQKRLIGYKEKKNV